ncbi:MAG: ChaN family lipoprotein [Chthoniobacterales bacterium]
MKRWLLLAVALTSGCGTPGRPPLPKFALGEAPRPTTAEQASAARLRQADVIYFGLTKRSAASGQPAWRVVQTLQGSAQRVALGWTDLTAAQQPLLDQWQRREISASQLLAQLALAERGDWLRPVLRPDLLQAALGAPRDLLRKIRAGESLSVEERALLPQGYRPRTEAFDDFVDRVSTAPRLRRYHLSRLYRAHLAAEQIIAENIVRFLHDHPGTKLIVFLPNDIMINPREIADYAAQKAALHQMILDRAPPPNESHPQLLARGGGGALQIVDRAPEPVRHDRRFSAPRLRA